MEEEVRQPCFSACNRHPRMMFIHYLIEIESGVDEALFKHCDVQYQRMLLLQTYFHASTCRPTSFTNQTIMKHLKC